MFCFRVGAASRVGADMRGRHQPQRNNNRFNSMVGHGQAVADDFSIGRLLFDMFFVNKRVSFVSCVCFIVHAGMLR